MAQDMARKREFIAVYDYDTGGVWFIINARSAEEIMSKWPFLTVTETRPSWMTDERFDETFRNRQLQDIDEPEIDLLKLMRESLPTKSQRSPSQ
jgi:hypothetical protein